MWSIWISSLYSHICSNTCEYVLWIWMQQSKLSVWAMCKIVCWTWKMYSNCGAIYSSGDNCHRATDIHVSAHLPQHLWMSHESNKKLNIRVHWACGTCAKSCADSEKYCEIGLWSIVPLKIAIMWFYTYFCKFAATPVDFAWIWLQNSAAEHNEHVGPGQNCVLVPLDKVKFVCDW